MGGYLLYFSYVISANLPWVYMMMSWEALVYVGSFIIISFDSELVEYYLKVKVFAINIILIIINMPAIQKINQSQGEILNVIV